ncbi:uncharacterized protein LOC117123266 [Anneissia japonica]|uniref:uncharacterized protein LOC117123266 n=1 Tax=Anneissia japonica TaxID=1529436 RepID=UPI001425B516|nr:uncharacterized protein LOC117123266 [Anneissia japonica]
MALSAAERAKKYRDNLKNDLARREIYLKKERQRKRKNYVPISDKTPQEQRMQRKQWRKGSQRFRDKQKGPGFPMSPAQMSSSSPPATPPPRRTDRRTQRGRRKVKAARAKAYRKIIRLEKGLRHRSLP